MVNHTVCDYWSIAQLWQTLIDWLTNHGLQLVNIPGVACKKAKLQAGIKPTALCSAIDKENSIEFPLDFLLKELGTYSNVQEVRFVSTTASVYCWLYWPKITASRIQDKVLQFKKRKGGFLIKFFTAPLSEVRGLYIQISYLDYP